MGQQSRLRYPDFRTPQKRRPGHIPGKNPGPSTCRRTLKERARRLHCLYARNARRCPVPRGPCMAVREPSHRLYNCARCGEQVRICRRCDRGNVYCARACAGVRRRESLRRAAERYQLSPRGARRHAARQRAWRERRAHKVTHQGSLASAFAATVAAVSSHPQLQGSHGNTPHIEPRSFPPCTSRPAPRCSFCARALSPFARLGPLRGGP
jgi:hypothetical protein